MKKFTLLLISLLLLAASVYSQSQRLVIFEEFTNASCGPCATYNPALDNLLHNNTTKATSIKYHTSWPGTDPMYNHNTKESAARVSYYGLNTVPHIVMDGNAYNGSVPGVNQAMINNQYNVPSKLELSVNQELTSNNDSIIVTMLGKVTGDIPGTAFAHMVIIEKQITFTTAPGYNGEKVFYNVMKKMLPDAQGTQLPNNLKVGDYFLIRDVWKLANVYNNAQLSVVGFVQENTNKAIFQSANTSATPITAPFNNDVEVSNLTNILPNYCNSELNPIFKIRNNGSNAVTSIEFGYSVNDQETGFYTQNTNINFLEEASVTFPINNFDINENNNFKIFVNKVNGIADQYVKNDTIFGTFEKSKFVADTLEITLRFDKSPEETSWEVYDLSTGSVIASGSGYTTAETKIVEKVAVEMGKCYDFVLYDSGNNGMCCDNGMGYCIISGDYGNVGVANKFTDKIKLQFSAVDATNAEFNAISQLKVYPNPISNILNISYTNTNAKELKYQIIDLQGKILQNGQFELSTGSNIQTIDCTKLQSGFYFMKLNFDNKKTEVRKISVIK